MSRPRVKMEKIREIARLKELHYSAREMNKITGISRPVIASYLSLFGKYQLIYDLIQGLNDDSLSEILFPDQG